MISPRKHWKMTHRKEISTNRSQILRRGWIVATGAALATLLPACLSQTSASTLIREELATVKDVRLSVVAPLTRREFGQDGQDALERAATDYASEILSACNIQQSEDAIPHLHIAVNHEIVRGDALAVYIVSGSLVEPAILKRRFRLSDWSEARVSTWHEQRILATERGTSWDPILREIESLVREFAADVVQARDTPFDEDNACWDGADIED